jgi:hypothetical protein
METAFQRNVTVRLSLKFIILGVKIYTLDREDRVSYWRDEFNGFAQQLEEQRSWEK